MNTFENASTIGIIGAGTMGNGIAQVALSAGAEVLLFDQSAESVENGVENIKNNFKFLVKKNKLDKVQAKDHLSRLSIVRSLDEFSRCHLIIEAIVENESIKKKLFSQLEEIVSKDVILATNTSSISITALGSELQHPERLVGIHFFNPAPRMRLVEVVTGLKSSDENVNIVKQLVEEWGKTPVITKSTPGFIVNRVARPFYGEALRMLAEQVADHETVDTVINECGGFPLGPCKLMDLIGIDVNLSVTKSVFEATYFDPRYAPTLYQEELVRAGKLGRKTSEGFYKYPLVNMETNETKSEITNGTNARFSIKHDPLLKTFIKRLKDHGIQLEKFNPQTKSNLATIAITNGKTATQRAKEEDIENLIHIDLCLDYEKTPRIAIASSSQCDKTVLEEVISTLEKTNLKISVINDEAGMIVARTVSMLINEAADLVHQGVATVDSVDSAMMLGTGYPIGPLLWADRIGPINVLGILDNLGRQYSPSRYRPSPLLRKKAITNDCFHR